MNDFEFSGTHVFCDVSGIEPEFITNSRLILEALHSGIHLSGATLCSMQVKEFEPTGLTAVYLLSESHVSVHTYPQRRSLFLDAFTCGERCNPEVIVDTLLCAIGICEYRTSIVHRGVARAYIGSPATAESPRPRHVTDHSLVQLMR